MKKFQREIQELLFLIPYLSLGVMATLHQSNIPCGSTFTQKSPWQMFQWFENYFLRKNGFNTSLSL